MNGDLHSLKQDFSSMVHSVQPWILSHFVMWLDLKVSEFKVNGYMLLDQGAHTIPKWMPDSGDSPSQIISKLTQGHVSIAPRTVFPAGSPTAAYSRETATFLKKNYRTNAFVDTEQNSQCSPDIMNQHIGCASPATTSVLNNLISQIDPSSIVPENVDDSQSNDGNINIDNNVDVDGRIDDDENASLDIKLEPASEDEQNTMDTPTRGVNAAGDDESEANRGLTEEAYQDSAVPTPLVTYVNLSEQMVQPTGHSLFAGRLALQRIGVNNEREQSSNTTADGTSDHGFQSTSQFQSGNFNNSFTSGNKKMIPKAVCTICGAMFRCKSSLSRHKWLHGEKRYRCFICERAFHRKEHMYLHLERHAKSSEIICPVCNVKGTSMQWIDKHYRQCHPSHPSPTLS